MSKRIRSLWNKNRQLILYAGFDLGGKALFFLLPIIFAIAIGNEEFGVYSLGMTVVYLLTAVAVQSSQNPFIVLSGEQYNGEEKINKAFSARLIVIIPLVLISCLLLLSFPDQVSAFSQTPNNISIYLCLAVIGIGVRLIFDSLFLALKEKVLYGIYSFTGAVFGIMYFALLYFSNNLTAELFYVNFLVSNFLGAIVLFPFIKFSKLFPLAFDHKEVSKLIDHTKWVGLGLIAMNVINWGDNYFFILYDVAKADIGVYNFAYQFFKGFILVATSMTSFILPTAVAQINSQAYLNKFLVKTRWDIMKLWIIGSISVGVILTLSLQLDILRQYQGGIGIIWILIIAAVFMMYRRLYEPIFNARQQFKFLQLSNLIMVLTNIVLNFLLVPVYGTWGAAIATMAAYLVMMILHQWWFTSKRLGLVQ